MDSRFKDILEPLSEEAPCGDDLSFSSEFDRVQEARREDDPTMDYGEWQTTLKQADWNAVAHTCTQLLLQRSKDVRLSAWLAEGLIKTDGFAGLADGMEVMACLMERFGPDLYPKADTEDQEVRVGTMRWFISRMSQLVRQVAITEGGTGCFSLHDYDSARLLQVQLQRHPDALSDGENRITLEQFFAAVAQTDNQHYIDWLDDIKRCRSALQNLARASAMLYGMENPSFTLLAESLDDVSLRLQVIGQERGIVNNPAAVISTNPENLALNMTDPSLQMDPSLTIRTRTQALEQLRQVAAFFRITEPHSPVAYLADKAAQWGDMSLHSWLCSVVKDHGTLSHIEELLGMKADADDGR